MQAMDLSPLADDLRPTGAWAASLLHALARDEAAGRRPPRVTEPKLDTWRRFRGRLSTTDFAELLFEDAAVLHPVPFDPGAIAAAGGPLRPGRLPSSLVEAWLAALGAAEASEGLKGRHAEYIVEQAKLLGLSTRMARSELHVVKPHQKVLELPGTGGQLAHHLVSSQKDVTLHENFVVACGSWQELTLAGIIGLDLGAPHSDFAVRVEDAELRDREHAIRQRTFDFVVGLSPDKGGRFKVEDELAIWFPNAKVVLV